MSENGVYLAVVAIVHRENDDSPVANKGIAFFQICAMVKLSQATLSTFPVDP